MAADIERTNVWFIENNIFNILVTNTSQSNINALVLSVYDSCSNKSSPEYITMALGNNFKAGQEKLFKVKLPMWGGGDLNRKKCIDVSFVYTSPPPPAAPDGYVSIYMDPQSSACSWAAGHQTQGAADASARASCGTRGAISPCKKIIGGPYKCLAIFESTAWRGVGVGNTLEEARSSARSNCESKSGSAPCYMPAEGSACTR